ncbi:hypothetical protein D3C73_984780 [compost metagenome]
MKQYVETIFVKHICNFKILVGAFCLWFSDVCGDNIFCTKFFTQSDCQFSTDLAVCTNDNNAFFHDANIKAFQYLTTVWCQGQSSKNVNL